MDSNPNTPQKVYKSSEIIQAVLDALGLQRTNSSEYVTYTADGKVLRVRVSDHGVNLSAWYRNNEGEVIPLSNSDNIAFTFLPNRDECKTLNIKFPPKVINKTPVYSDLKTKTPIDYEFTVMHYVYSSWKFTEENLNLLTNAIVNYTTSGKFFLSTNVHLVTLNLTDKCLCIVLSVQFANLLQHIPSGSLTYFDITAQLTRGNTLLVRGNEIHGNEPLHKREVAVFKYCADSAREIAFALIATELSVLACGTVMLSTIRTNEVLVLTDTPSCFHECLSASVFVIEVHRNCDKAVEL